MKKLTTISAVIFGVIFLAGCSLNTPPPANQISATTTVACTKEARVCPDGSAVGRTGPKCEFELCPATANDKASGQLPINIKPNQVISLPFTLIGKAANQFEGQWGNVKMYDSQDNLLTTKLISTPCDYGKSCDFSVVLDGMTKTSTGYLIFSQDNPSGLPQNEYSYRINIGFNNNQTAGWKTYTNTQYGFEFKYPAAWKIEENKGEVTEGSSIAGVNNPDIVGKLGTDQPIEFLGISFKDKWVCPVPNGYNKQTMIGGKLALDSGWILSISTYRNLCFNNGIGIHISETSGDSGQKIFANILSTFQFIK